MPNSIGEPRKAYLCIILNGTPLDPCLWNSNLQKVLIGEGLTKHHLVTQDRVMLIIALRPSSPNLQLVSSSHNLVGFSSAWSNRYHMIHLVLGCAKRVWSGLRPPPLYDSI